MIRIHTPNVGFDRDIIHELSGYVVAVVANGADIPIDHDEAYWLVGTEVTSAGLAYALIEHHDDDEEAPSNRRRVTRLVDDHTLVVF